MDFDLIDTKESQIGRIAYWNDPDDGLCSNLYRITGFIDDYYTLVGLYDEGYMEALEDELTLFDDEKQIELYIEYFNSEKFKKSGA